MQLADMMGELVPVCRWHRAGNTGTNPDNLSFNRSLRVDKSSVHEDLMPLGSVLFLTVACPESGP